MNCHHMLSVVVYMKIAIFLQVSLHIKTLLFTVIINDMIMSDSIDRRCIDIISLFSLTAKHANGLHISRGSNCL